MHRHAVDVIALVFGTVFAGLTLIWVLGLNDWIDSGQAWLAGPLILIAAGAAGLLAALRPRGRRREEDGFVS